MHWKLHEPNRRMIWLLAGVLIAAHAALTFQAATWDSQTWDEAVHLSVGYSVAPRGVFDLERQTFLAGAVSGTGWWYYFPTALALKTPIATVVLLALALPICSVLTLRGRRQHQLPGAAHHRVVVTILIATLPPSSA